uniref:Uncharacterized protein n=1 Tax=Trichogramma kaykai TaxID=54128 RepID=A0ABD2WCF0_9HYME
MIERQTAYQTLIEEQYTLPLSVNKTRASCGRCFTRPAISGSNSALRTIIRAAMALCEAMYIGSAAVPL